VLVKRRRLMILGAVAVLLEGWRLLVLNTPQLRDGLMWQTGQRTDVVLGGIVLGSVFAVALTKPRVLRVATRGLRVWLALLYAGFVFFEVQRHHSEQMQRVLLTVYPVLIVATVLHPESWFGRFLELAPVRYLGRISYSLYLWQQLFFYEQEAVDPHSFHSHTLLCWGLTFACAIASYTLIETPMIRRGHRIAKRFDLETRRELAA
jgi:peptidoglycan/LPS O-acetylase OafA/YrhL